MATSVINRGQPPHLDDIDQQPYLAASSLVGIRLWTRRDRSAIERWPRIDLPAHWQVMGAASGLRISFAIDELPRPQLVGRITLREVSDIAARIGIYLHPDYLGQGIGSNALMTIQRHLFGSGMQKLLLDVATDNTRAVRAYIRAGWQVTTEVQRGGFAYYEMQVHS